MFEVAPAQKAVRQSSEAIATKYEVGAIANAVKEQQENAALLTMVNTHVESLSEEGIKEETGMYAQKLPGAGLFINRM